MQEITILALNEDRSALLNELQNLGVMELEDINPGDTQLDKENLERSLVQNQRLQNYQVRLDRAIRALRRRYPEEAEGQKGDVLKAHEFFKRSDNRQEILGELIDYEHDLQRETAINNRREELRREQDILADWRGLDMPLGTVETENTRSVFGSFPSEETLDAARDALKDAELASAIIPLFEVGDSPKVAVVYLKNEEGRTKSVMAATDFRAFPLDKEGESANFYYLQNEKEDQELEAELAEIDGRLRAHALQLSDFMLLSDFYNIRRSRLEAQGQARYTNYTFLLRGYIPKDQSAALKQRLEQEYVVNIELKDLAPEDNPPVLLKNPKFIRAYENVLEMFGAPNPSEWDPMPILAPFSFIFFGMMLSDVGYGLCLVLICLYLLKSGKVRGGGAKMVKMLFLSGISSTIWGFVFGGFFGNLLDKVTMGKVTFPALWFNPLDDPIKLLIWSMLFGVIHLFFGMGIDMYNKLQHGDWKAAWFDVFPWYLIITGAGMLLGKGSFPVGIQDIAGKVAFVLMGVGAAVIVLMAGRDVKNPIGRLLKGLLGLYDITGFLSDVLSYSRILALVLATSVIALVFNEIGMLLGPTIPGYILFIISALIGHTLNLALSALSAFVHSSRLQYVEFFGKFYESGGKFFEPLKLETEHYWLEDADKIDGGPRDKEAQEAA